MLQYTLSTLVIDRLISLDDFFILLLHYATLRIIMLAITVERYEKIIIKLSITKQVV